MTLSLTDNQYASPEIVILPNAAIQGAKLFTHCQVLQLSIFIQYLLKSYSHITELSYE
jgi:hypothetical protein